ncbi:transporter substrate-binding domain-containing protein [Litoreibacter albidus]|uniref:transporter substrate-binding domain-containing protein n=1 Tax=Litoreibacter albidus TaxID=670155 RepID=UPI0037359E8E
MKFAYLTEPPFNYLDNNGRPTGCDVELARHVCTTLGLMPFKPVMTEFPSLLAGLAAGDWRMTTGMFATDARRRVARFSRSIWALPDGLLIRAVDDRQSDGYRAIAASGDARLAVVRDQVQHQTALELGVPSARIDVFESYRDAAGAVRRGHVAGFASVARAHAGYIAQNPTSDLGVVPIAATEKPAAFGCFAFARDDAALVRDVDTVLTEFLGSSAHRQMLARFGFSDAEVDLIAP